MKKILETSDAWSTIRLSNRPSEFQNKQRGFSQEKFTEMTENYEKRKK